MDKFVTIHEWMLELGLKGTEITVFAIVFAFTEKQGWYTGSASYLAKWIGRNRITATHTLADMVKKGILERREKWVNGEKNVDFRVCQKLYRGVCEKRTGGCIKNEHHNNSSDINSSYKRKEINNKEMVQLSLDEFKKTLR